MGNRKKRKKSYPAPYKSGLEHRLHSGPLKKLEYEPDDSILPYIIDDKSYHPDFVSPHHKDIVYEAKGRFRTWEEAKKYIYVRRSNPHITIRFIIINPDARAYPQANITMGAWLSRNGFEWCTEDNIPREWRK